MQDSAESVAERIAGKLVNLLVARSADDGALPLVFAATAPQAPTGRFLGPRLRRSDKRIWADAIGDPALDRDLAARLWQRLEDATATVPS
ncbi:MAG: hypothetical protein ACRDN9_11130 [Streptosporangiaceae bacterium]